MCETRDQNDSMVNIRLYIDFLQAAAAMKSKGKTEDAFEDSKYSLPEEARTPNLRTLSVSDIPKLLCREKSRKYFIL